MPVVQRYGQDKVAPAALPGERLTAAETPLSEGAGLAEAQGQQAEQLGRLAGTAGAIATTEIQKARDEADADVSMAASNALGKATIDIRDRALTVKGKDTLALPDSTAQEFNTAADAISGTLSNDRQRQAFAKVRSQHDLDLYATVGSHVSTQLQAYRSNELQATVDLGVNSVAAHALDPDQTIGQQALQHVVDTIHQQASAMGWGPQETTEAVATVKSKAIVSVIERLLVNNQDEKATQVYDEAKTAGAIQGDALKGVEQKLETGSSMGNGLRTSQQLWAQFGPKTDSDPIDLDKMEAAAEEKFANNPKALDATIHFLREKKAGVDASRKDREDVSNGALWKAVSQGATLAELSQMPEFLAAPGKLQNTLTDSVVSRAEHVANRAVAAENLLYTRENRIYTQEQRSRTLQKQVWDDKYYEYADPVKLSQMTVPAIEALRGTVGDENTDKLLTRQKRLTDPAAIRAATIDTQQFEGIATRANITSKADKIRLKDVVEAEIAREESGSKRGLTREAKGTLMQQIVDEHVMTPGAVFGALWPSSQVGALVTNPTQRAAAYVPIEKIPKDVVTQYQNYARSEAPHLGTIPAAWIQHAYALRAMGAPLAEIQAALKGQP